MRSGGGLVLVGVMLSDQGCKSRRPVESLSDADVNRIEKVFVERFSHAE